MWPRATVPGLHHSWYCLQVGTCVGDEQGALVFLILAKLENSSVKNSFMP